ncbi:PLP-dependent aminotransferase family protein [Candidatus Poribacteria bacterium]|nr:PLP-dependent aminotransferase family protein [Candidatus Poribacteria bacterium]
MSSLREINFTGGMPDPDTFPVEGLIGATARALRRVGGKTLVRYPGDHGDIELRRVAADRLASREGTRVPTDDIAIASGSMQAIDLVIRAYVKPGDTVICEETTYMGTLGALRHAGARLVGVPVDGDGMVTSELGKTLAGLTARGVHPALIYTVPTNQNPTGANLSKPRRRELVELAEKYDVLVFEDDCYADIHFEGEPIPSMYGIAPQGCVVHVGTFSKVVGPGMRLGYLIAPPSRMVPVLAGRFDGGTSAFASIVLAEYLRDHLWGHIATTNSAVRAKRDALVAGIRRYVPDLASCIPPFGGLFAWVRVPDSTDMDRLMAELARLRVLCTRGRTFHVQEQDIPYVRFSFGYPTLDEIDEGMRRFGQAVRASVPSAAVL